MITINLEKAKLITHEHRRIFREGEFQPIDDKIVKRIPGQSFDELEAQRQIIRDKYATLQTQIDSVNTVDDLYSILHTMATESK